jgi:putative tricarboxylic transport membrane protein
VVALPLNTNIEKHFREALFLSQGDPWIYVESPIAITVWLLVAAILIAGFVARRRAAFAEAMAQESSL